MLQGITTTSTDSLVEIDAKIAGLKKELDDLQRARRILDFMTDPDGYEARILATKKANEVPELAPRVQGPDNALRKPNGTHRSTEQMVLDVFNEYPGVLFNAGTMLSKLQDRGWISRSRSPGNTIGNALNVLYKQNRISRPDRGVYAKKDSAVPIQA